MTASAVGSDNTLDSLVGAAVDDFLRRQRDGENPNIEEYTARHPEAADLLRNVLAALQLLEQSSEGQASPTASAAAKTGTFHEPLGDFRLLREVGRGGMGIVYEAEQMSLARRVALKVLPFASTLDSRQLQRFKNEAQAAACLHHTHIVPVFATGCERGVHFYAMQFIEGHTLAELIDGLREEDAKARLRHLSPKANDGEAADCLLVRVTCIPACSTAVAELSTLRSTRPDQFCRAVAELGIQAAEALDYAHQMGIVHRDIKPANLILDNSARTAPHSAHCLWITDFGLAHTQSQAGLTMTGDLLGTLRYMSPEQALGNHGVVDHRSDIYALGVTLYELLTLQPAFQGDDRQELSRQIAMEEPVPPRRINRLIPVELETIVLKAIAKEPETRYLSARALADDLRRFVENKPIQARRSSLAERGRKWVRRHQGAVTAAVLLLLMAVAALTVTTLVIADQREEAIRQRQQTRQAMRELTAGLEAWVSQHRSFDPEPHFEQVQRFYRELEVAPESAGDSEVQYEIAQVHHLLGELYSRRANKEASVACYQKAIALLDKLAAQFPLEPRYRRELAVCYHSLGSMGGKSDELRRSLETSAVLLEKLVAEAPEDPAYRWRLAQVHSTLASLSQMPWDDPARRKEAELHFDRAVALQEQLVNEFPKTPSYRMELGRTYQSVASFFKMTQRETASLQARRRADELFGLNVPGMSFLLPDEAQHITEQAAAAAARNEKKQQSLAPEYGTPEPPGTSVIAAKHGLAQFDQRPTVSRPMFDLHSITDLVQAPAVLDLLRLTPAESQAIAACVKELMESEDAVLVVIQQLPFTLRSNTLSAWVREASMRRRPVVDKVRTTLGEERFARLQQIRWQVIGLYGVCGLELRAKLGISRDQIQALNAALGPVGEFPMPPGVMGMGYAMLPPRHQRQKRDYDQVVRAQDDRDNRVLPLLTPDQRERWRNLCGAPIDAATRRAILEAVDGLY